MREFRFAAPTTLLTALLLSGASPAPVSDPVGVYALIDRVEVQPETGPAERIRIWGVFAVSDGRSGDNYYPPVRGYMYYRVNGNRPDVTRIEWNDLKSVAGTGQAIGYGGRYERNGKVRRPGDAPSNPDVYPLGFGIVKVLRAHLGAWIERGLKHVPEPLRPADGARVPPGSVQLVTRNVENPDARYVFEIEDAAGRIETSEPMPPGEDETAWTPGMMLRAGQEYTWRVNVVAGDYVGRAAEARVRASSDG